MKRMVMFTSLVATMVLLAVGRNDVSAGDCNGPGAIFSEGIPNECGEAKVVKTIRTRPECMDRAEMYAEGIPYDCRKDGIKASAPDSAELTVQDFYSEGIEYKDSVQQARMAAQKEKALMAEPAAGRTSLIIEDE